MDDKLWSSCRHGKSNIESQRTQICSNLSNYLALPLGPELRPCWLLSWGSSNCPQDTCHFYLSVIAIHEWFLNTDVKANSQYKVDKFSYNTFDHLLPKRNRNVFNLLSSTLVCIIILYRDFWNNMLTTSKTIFLNISELKFSCWGPRGT